MCGIAGFVGDHARHNTSRMIALIKHRGPDGMSLWDNGTVSMGHAHLKITGDASQPVISGDRVVTYNGEIYNFTHFLPGTSDTTALADAILKNGAESFLKAAPSIDGEYAFAYYDGSKLMLARDPVGIKPLFYGKNHEGLGFASEKKALMHIGIEDIHALNPGCIYVDGKEQKAISLPPYRGDITDPGEAADQLDKALREAVRLRVHENAAVAFSGGVDCALVGAMSGLPLCTVGLEGSYDVKAAKKAASLMGAEHLVYEFSEKDVVEVLPDVIYSVESADPMKVSIALPIYILAREARKSGYKVLLSGQGADELFGGYSRYAEAGGSSKLGEMLQSDLEQIAGNNLERDDAAAMAHGVEMRVPYLDLAVIGISQRIDTSLKVYFDGKDYIRKYILRFLSEKYLPDEIASAPKKAIQYGTGVQKTLEKLAKSEGYKGTGDYFKSLYKVVF
ncbi:MAG TPA: asparagine synthetase B [Methanocellaceae archaeon]